MEAAPNVNLWEGNALKDALIRLGLTGIAAREFMENGVTDVHRLCSLDEKGLTRLIKTITKDRDGGAGPLIPFMAKEYIHASLFWTHRQYSLGLPYDAELFHLADAEYWIQKIRDQEDADDAAKDLIKTPELFKKDTEWLSWSESVITYLRSQKGVNNAAPLTYVLREHDVPTPDMIFATDTDEKIGCTILVGPQFNTDNAKVYDLFKSLAGNGPLQPFIRTYEQARNGKAAWKNLLQFYEGDSMKHRLKSSAYKIIQRANYQGPRRNFEFSNSVTIHQRAHEHLARFGEPVPELKKVRDFFDGITDPRCQAIKLGVQASSLYMNSFNEMVNYVTGVLDTLNSQGAPLTTRRICELSTNEHHQGRGRGRGRDRNANLARSYTPEEWQALTPDERARVFQARERNRGGGGGRYHRGGRHGGYRGGRGGGRYIC